MTTNGVIIAVCIGVLLTIALYAWQGIPARADAPTGQSWSMVGRDYWRMVDNDFGVVCYTAPFPQTAIACVRMK